MKISPINNQISHRAVNQKFFKQAVKEYEKWAPYHDQGHLIRSIMSAAYYRLISYQDAIDTLEAIKPYAQNALEVINYRIELLKNSSKESNQ